MDNFYPVENFSQVSRNRPLLYMVQATRHFNIIVDRKKKFELFHSHPSNIISGYRKVVCLVRFKYGFHDTRPLQVNTASISLVAMDTRPHIGVSAGIFLITSFDFEMVHRWWERMKAHKYRVCSPSGIGQVDLAWFDFIGKNNHI